MLAFEVVMQGAWGSIVYLARGTWLSDAPSLVEGQPIPTLLFATLYLVYFQRDPKIRSFHEGSTIRKT